jgi:anaerobic selenocysteine-containing dehydrogenase
MKRRDFLRLSALSGAAFALEGCSKRSNQLVRFLPEETLVPGVAIWKPSICTLCSAGCGLQVRVMEGDAEVIRNGQLGLVKMGLAKKLEGNPNHPVNHGKLCPRGQAGLQVTYNPDRVRHPLKRTGPRGSGQFAKVSWDEALQQLIARLRPLTSQKSSASLAFLSRPLRGQRRDLVGRFLSGFGRAQLVQFDLFDDSVLRKANELSFGHNQLPTFDLARSNYLISFGADFLGTWNSPVAQSFAYGDMRQGRPGVRGKFVQVETRMSQTGANADEWIAVRPGTEGELALGLAHVILNQDLATPETAGVAGTQIAGWRGGLRDYSPEAVAWTTGVAPDTIVRLAHEMATNRPSVAIVGGASLAHTNGLFIALAVNALNALLGSAMRPGGLQFTPQVPLSSPHSSKEWKALRDPNSIRDLSRQILSETPHPVGALLLYETNPIFSTPPEWHVREAIETVPFTASFGNFIDETSSYADLVLPDHSYLESWLDDVTESGATEAAFSVAPPVMLPLHDTRAMPDVVLDVAHQLGGAEHDLPWKSYEEMLQASLTPLRHFSGSISAESDDEFWKKFKEQGVWQSAKGNSAASIKRTSLSSAPPLSNEKPEFDSSEAEFPFHFLPYASQQFFDGTQANLPWMQEMPEPLTTGMWSSWVEINPQTASRLGIEEGDLVEVASSQGKVRAPAVLLPGISPDVIAMPIGQGHEEYGRFATGRGVNPLKILSPRVAPHTSSWAWAATMVGITRVGKGELIQFSGGPTEWNEQKVAR